MKYKLTTERGIATLTIGKRVLKLTDHNKVVHIVSDVQVLNFFPSPRVVYFCNGRYHSYCIAGGAKILGKPLDN